MNVLDVSRQTQDGSLWVALLARKTEKDRVDQVRDLIANQILSLGIMPALDEEGCILYPQGPPRSAEKTSLIFERLNASDERIRYEPLDVSLEEDPLARPSIVKIKLPTADKLKVWAEEPYMAGVGNRPPSLQETDALDRLITWIRIRSPQVETSKEASSRQLSINLSWTGINATTVIQRTRVPAERLTEGTGEPDQVVKLTNTPVIKDSLELMINGEVWHEIDDINAAQPEVPLRSPRFSTAVDRPSASGKDLVKVYSLDLESGEIRFGDGAHGMRPPAGATIQAAYSYGGGRQGVVAIGSINKAPALYTGLKVHNPVPTWGGSEGETVHHAERNIPKFIKHRDRLVSYEDFREITLRTPGIELGRVEILPLFHPKLPDQKSGGVVTVLVIPETDPGQPSAPRPDRLFLETVCTHLGPRRILTTEVHVRGPEYVPVWASVSINVVPGYEEETVREKVKKEIEGFLSPLKGGFEGRGWPLDKVVDKLEVSAAVTRVDGVSKVNQLRLCEDDGAERSEIIIKGLELPQLMKVVVVTDGEAPELDYIRGESEPSPVDADGIGMKVPVPVIPPECGIS